MSARLDVALPSSGLDATTYIHTDSIGVRVRDRACIAHRRWMTADELDVVAEQAAGLAASIRGGRT